MSEHLQQPLKPPPPPQQPPPPPSDVPPSTAAPPSTPSSDAKKPAPPEPDTVTVPTYSSWFTWNGVHEVEYKNNPEFFTGKSQSKTPTLYKYYRNAIVKMFRSNPGKKITFTEARRTVVGDVGSIRRVFDFLETWGLINYSPPSGKQPVRWDDKESKTSAANAAAGDGGGGGGGAVEGNSNANQKSRKWCSCCKSVCTIACFVSDQHNLVLCARCYVRGNYRVGISSTEFRRVEISELAKSEWSDKETIQLLEAVMLYGDDWKFVAEHVAGRSEKDCVARFIRLPFGEQFVESTDFNEESLSGQESLSSQLKDQNDTDPGEEPVAKKMRLTPLADVSNPIMAQAAFLSALAGVEVSEAAAQAAVATLYYMGHHSVRDTGSGVASRDNSSYQASEEARVDAEVQLTQEEDRFLKSISTMTEVKMKDILYKLRRFEVMDLQLEKEWQQFRELKRQLFLDKLTLSFHKIATSKPAERVTDDIVRRE